MGELWVSVCMGANCTQGGDKLSARTLLKQKEVGASSSSVGGWLHPLQVWGWVHPLQVWGGGCILFRCVGGVAASSSGVGGGASSSDPWGVAYMNSHTASRGAPVFPSGAAG